MTFYLIELRVESLFLHSGLVLWLFVLVRLQVTEEEKQKYRRAEVWITRQSHRTCLNCFSVLSSRGGCGTALHVPLLLHHSTLHVAPKVFSFYGDAYRYMDDHKNPLCFLLSDATLHLSDEIKQRTPHITWWKSVQLHFTTCLQLRCYCKVFIRFESLLHRIHLYGSSTLTSCFCHCRWVLTRWV